MKKKDPQEAFSQRRLRKASTSLKMALYTRVSLRNGKGTALAYRPGQTGLVMKVSGLTTKHMGVAFFTTSTGIYSMVTGPLIRLTDLGPITM